MFMLMGDGLRMSGFYLITGRINCPTTASPILPVSLSSFLPFSPSPRPRVATHSSSTVHTNGYSLDLARFIAFSDFMLAISYG